MPRRPSEKSFLEKKNVDEKGFFTAWFARNIDHKVLENLKVRYESEHRLEPYSRRHAVMNILGFIYHKCHGDNPAPQEMFKKVLEEDPTNVNALLNLMYVYDFAGQKSDSVKYHRQYDRLKLHGDAKHQKVMYARHLYEISVFMLSREETFLSKNHKVITENLQHAIALGKETALNKDEIAIWKFALGSTFMRIDSVLAERKNPESKFMKSAVKNLYDVAIHQLDPNQLPGTFHENTLQEAVLDTKGKAWAYMGTVLWRRYAIEILTLSTLIDHKKLQPDHTQFDALECFDTARSIAPHTPTVLRRIGQAYTDSDNEELTGVAYEFLVKAVEAEPIGYAYSLLGQWFLKQYESDKSKKDSLTQAIENFQKAIDGHCDMFVLFQCLAKAYEYDKKIDKALKIFASCEGTHEGPRTVELYTLWADLLERSGHPKSAAKKRKLAEDTQMGRNPKQMRDFGVLYNKKDEKTVTKFVENAESRFSASGYFLDRDLIPGDDVVNGLVHMQNKCRKIIIFLTENFDKGNQSDLRQIRAARKSETDTIVPLLAKKGELPDPLRHVFSLKYDKSEYFWEKLGQVLGKGPSPRIAALHHVVQEIFSSPERRLHTSLAVSLLVLVTAAVVTAYIIGRFSCKT